MQRQNFFRLIRFSSVLLLTLLVIVLGGPIKPEASVQSVSFGPKTDFGTGFGPASVAVGDFNDDGKLDLAAANFDGNTVSILLGTGPGSFGAKTDFGTGAGPASAAVGDFNDDGKLDLAVANHDSDTVSILLGTGAGSFGAKTDFATGSAPRSEAVGDFNGDGKLDLAVANQSGDTVSILLGTGTGSFGAKTDFGTGISPFSVAVSDFNGDGRLDLAVANLNSNNVSILLGTGTGSFGPKADFATGSLPRSVAAGDFNGDGKLDLAIADQNSSAVSILLGTGTGSLGPKTDFGTGSSPASVAVGDFNSDGKLDLAVANLNSNTVSILLGTGTGSFGAKTDFGTGSSPASVGVGDFNGDGKPDLAVANFFSSTVSILLNTTPVGCSGAFSPKTDFSTGNFSESVAVGDFNNDGKLDLAVVNLNSSDVTILLGNGSGGFSEPAGSPVSAGLGADFVAVADFNLDGKLDLAIANGFTPGGTVTILLGNGVGGFAQPPGSPVSAGDGPQALAVADFNLDGKPDLAVAEFNTNNVTILLGNGMGAFSQPPGSPVPAGTHPQFLVATDFNLDGKPDLAVVNIHSNNVTILLGNGGGGFTEAAGSPVSVGDFPFAAAVGDFNLDGKPDLAVGDLNNDMTILLGNGSGGFTQAAGSPFFAGSAPFYVAVGDFNLDGKPDLAIANLGGDNVSIFPGMGTGSFGAKTDFGTGTNPSSVGVGDFNRDGKLDLAVANSGSNTVSILLNGCTDNQPPTITCPTNLNTAAPSSCPIATGTVVTYPPPTATDNFPGVTVACSPASGSTFPVGTTTVTCTATDASGNTATCSFNINVFSLCLQDETSPGNVVLINAQTGDYFFCCGGVPIASGRGTLTTRACIGSIDHTKGDRRVHIQWDTSATGGAGAGTAIVQTGSRTVCQISDRKMTDNNCVCSNSPPAFTK
ncbi:MAG TPA: FG-GAP-like repeat-containing protein [Blastocatellia bacterium]|nr:FG-GAP-like repeat-containing protein [Blastocatellia bacterium]